MLLELLSLLLPLGSWFEHPDDVNDNCVVVVVVVVLG